ncbi:hypothetical protein DSECCO2_633120 [anaerobic digester metagenome]
MPVRSKPVKHLLRIRPTVLYHNHWIFFRGIKIIGFDNPTIQLCDPISGRNADKLFFRELRRGPLGSRLLIIFHDTKFFAGGIMYSNEGRCTGIREPVNKKLTVVAERRIVITLSHG